MKKRLLYFTILLMCSCFSSNFATVKDSLVSIINKSENDSIKVANLFSLAEQYYYSNPDTTIVICKSALEISNHIDYVTGKANAYGWLGYLYRKKGLIKQAIEAYHLSISAFEKINDSLGVAVNLNNLGMLYKKSKEYDKAKEHYLRCFAYDSINNDTAGMMVVINNLGQIEYLKRNYKDAIQFFNKVIELNTKVGNKEAVYSAHKNKANALIKLNNYTEAEQNFSAALEGYLQMEDNEGVASVYANLGMLSYYKNDIQKTLIYGRKSFATAKNIGYPDKVRDASFVLYNGYKAINNTDSALKYHEQYILMKDSVFNKEIKSATIRQQTQYEFERKQLLQEQHEKEQARLIANEIKRRDNIQMSIIFIIVLSVFVSLLFLGFVKVSRIFAEGLIFFAFLILFEFILVLTDPFVEDLTNGAPAYKLIINAVFAAIIFPAHAFFEATLKTRLLKFKRK